MARPPSLPPRRPTDNGPRVNNQIRVPEIRLIDENGEMQGVVRVEDAIARAEEVGLDLVEVSPGAEPPVCKILDYGKYKYELQKKAAEARKKQKTVDIKEVKMRPGIEDHDYQVKLKSARRFLDAEDKVKVTLRFRGREMAHQGLALQVLERFRDDLAEISKVEQAPKMEGRQAIMVLVPDKPVPVKGQAPKKEAKADAPAADAAGSPPADKA